MTRTSRTSVPASSVFAKVLDNIRGGQAQKASPVDSADFMRAVLPLIAGTQRLFLAPWTNTAASSGWSRQRSPSKRCRKTRIARRMRPRCAALSSPDLPNCKPLVLQCAFAFGSGIHGASCNVSIHCHNSRIFEVLQYISKAFIFYMLRNAQRWFLECSQTCGPGTFGL